VPAAALSKVPAGGAAFLELADDVLGNVA